MQVSWCPHKSSRCSSSIHDTTLPMPPASGAAPSARLRALQAAQNDSDSDGEEERAAPLVRTSHAPPRTQPLQAHNEHTAFGAARSGPLAPPVRTVPQRL
jgi:hypothetical protein